MSPNRRRGEVAATLDGRERRLCLTLGALAELEAAFEAEDLGALVERFSSGRLSARVVGSADVRRESPAAAANSTGVIAQKSREESRSKPRPTWITSSQGNGSAPAAA
ncbi:MAG: gene transfer agent family protein, partial [Rhizobiales bacterium]|nr:gene transfer agent family protein [Hyphomicrobiales bacterium]